MFALQKGIFFYDKVSNKYLQHFQQTKCLQSLARANKWLNKKPGWKNMTAIKCQAVIPRSKTKKNVFRVIWSKTKQKIILNLCYNSFLIIVEKDILTKKKQRGRKQNAFIANINFVRNNPSAAKVLKQSNFKTFWIYKKTGKTC